MAEYVTEGGSDNTIWPLYDNTICLQKATTQQRPHIRTQQRNTSESGSWQEGVKAKSQLTFITHAKRLLGIFQENEKTENHP